MKKCNLEATYENLLNTLRDDQFGKSEELVDIIEVLDKLEDNFTISLDGDWGTGKTFFVKHLEMVLTYYYECHLGKNSDEGLAKIIVENGKLNKLKISKQIMPVYYNAWMYDNHSDPMASLIYNIINRYGIVVDSKIYHDVKSKAAKFLKLISYGPLSNVGEVFSSDGDILSDVDYIENIKNEIKNIFDDIITERTSKLLIIIDELDRCRPDYAVRVLERIKHFFDDDRIIFLVVVNKSELVHTISKFYGDNFSSTKYLNKFFTLNFRLANIDIKSYLRNRDLTKTFEETSHYFRGVIEDLINYESPSLRDANVFFQSMDNLEEVLQNYKDNHAIYLQLFIPIIFFYRITNIELSQKIENGKGIETINMLCDNLPILSELSDVARVYKALFNTGNETFVINGHVKAEVNNKLRSSFNHLLSLKI